MKSEWFKRWDDGEESDLIEEETGWKKKKRKKEKEKKSSFSFPTFYDSYKKSFYTPVKSTSAYLRSSYGSWYSSVTSRRSERDDLLEVLKEVNKTINLTQNSADGKGESNMIVRYSNGHCNNDLLSKILYISPNIMRDRNGDVFSKESDDYYNGLDALNGQAMLCSFMRKSVSSVANSQYVSCDNWAIRNIYMTDLQTTAGNEICHDWPGFRSYIEQQQLVFQMSKEEVLLTFQDPNQNIDNFINLLCYNRLSTDRINYQDYFDENISSRLDSADYYLNITLDEPWHNDGRFDRACEVFFSIQKILNLDVPPPPPPPPPSDCDKDDGDKDDPQDKNDVESHDPQDKNDVKSHGSGDSDKSEGGDQQGKSDNSQQNGKSDGNSDGQEFGKMDINSIDTNSNSTKDRRFTGDNSYNGQDIENKNPTDGNIDPNEKIKDRQNTESDSINNIEDKQLDNVCYKKIIPAVNDDERDDYKSFILKSRRIIKAIKDCFQFHNTEVGLNSYGLTTGNIDENSMFKVYMGEYHRLYERRDVLTRKKWLVSILIDQSGSMDNSAKNADGSWSTRQIQANELAIVFGEALRGLQDLEFSIYGFSTLDGEIDTFVYKDKEVSKIEALIHARSYNSTGIGFHVAHVGDKMISQYGEYENKILFVITDGMPNRSPTSTMNGIEHTKHCCDLLRKRGIQVYGIGIADAFDANKGDLLFGVGQHCVINDVAGTLNVLVNKVRTFLQSRLK